ncbi:MAG TPA: hypothetical protein PLE54_14160 [Burkholderiaceae bacterium]|nr:hypothetical protein [Burkholderiaceae bacterium]HQR71749.1 hypothetical protein [Burkholderiaceae bacterium]
MTLTGMQASAQSVQRCESRDGKVTYSNTACPEGTSSVRAVNTSPPVASDEQKSAKERARKEAAAAKNAEQARAKDEAKAERAAADEKKAQEKSRQQCEQARRDLEKARTTRAGLTEKRAASISDMQKADKEISRREADVAKACPT